MVIFNIALHLFEISFTLQQQEITHENVSGKTNFYLRLPGGSLTGVTVLQAFLSNQFHRDCQQPLAANEGIILFP